MHAIYISAMPIKLVCFDLDGTLVDDTVYIWHTLHDHFKTPKEKRKALADDFYAGKSTYAEWAGAEVREWMSKGADRRSLFAAVKGLRMIPGVREALRELKEKGKKLAIISGSLSFVLETAFPDYRDFFDDDDILISRLDFDDSGKIAGMRFTDFDMERKALGLKHLAEKHGFSLEECAFIGDHDNDIEIAKIAGLSIAFNSKSESLNEVCDHVAMEKDLREILALID
jgi:phosphoserine phosphatase